MNAARSTQLKGRCQTRGGVQIWKAPGAALQIGDAAAANASALGERFLREARQRSVTAQQAAESFLPFSRPPRVELHDSNIK
jgi:hypothetical protein